MRDGEMPIPHCMLQQLFLHDMMGTLLGNVNRCISFAQVLAQERNDQGARKHGNTIPACT